MTAAPASPNSITTATSAGQVLEMSAATPVTDTGVPRWCRRGTPSSWGEPPRPPPGARSTEGIHDGCRRPTSAMPTARGEGEGGDRDHGAEAAKTGVLRRAAQLAARGLHEGGPVLIPDGGVVPGERAVVRRRVPDGQLLGVDALGCAGGRWACTSVTRSGSRPRGSRPGYGRGAPHRPHRRCPWPFQPGPCLPGPPRPGAASRATLR